MWQIIINGPGYFDTPYELPEGVTSLGRADENDIVLSGDLVSRRHARIHIQNGQCSLEDLNSRNGTRVNGEARTGMSPLKIGDSIGVGENTLALRQPGAVESAATELVDPTARGIRRVDSPDMGSILFSKNLRDRSVLRALDNVLPFEPGEGFSAFNSPAPIRTQAQVPYPSLLLLYKTAAQLSTAPSLQAFLDGTMERLTQWVNATTAVVLLRQPGGAMAPATVRHRGQLAEGEVPVSASIIGAAMEQGAALAVADVRDDARFANRDSVILYGAGRVLCIPIGEKPPFPGVLYLNMAPGGEAELESVLDLCTAVANLIETGVEKFALKSQGPNEPAVREVLARSFPPDILERRLHVMRDGGRLAWEQRTLTTLRIELAQPSTVWEMGADRAGALLEELTRRASEVVFSFEGSVVSRTGDGLAAVFGAPEPVEDHAIRAVRAALAFRMDWTRLVMRNPDWGAVPIRQGVATGRSLSGHLGKEGWGEFCAPGEAMAVASQLASSGTAGQVLITGKTMAAVGAKFEVTALGPRTLRQGAERVPVFDVLEEDSMQTTEPGV